MGQTDIRSPPPQPQENFCAMRYTVKMHNPQTSGTTILGINSTLRNPQAQLMGSFISRVKRATFCVKTMVSEAKNTYQKMSKILLKTTEIWLGTGQVGDPKLTRKRSSWHLFRLLPPRHHIKSSQFNSHERLPSSISFHYSGIGLER